MPRTGASVGAVPAQPSTARFGGPGSRRARLRLGAVLLLGLQAALYLVLAVRLYFFPTLSPVASGLLGIALALAALVYGLLARAVARQSRPWHLVAVGVCALGALLAVSTAMGWPDWTALAVNLLALGLLLGCVPRRTATT